MNKEEYLTVKEFAKRVGVTNQTIYNRIDKDLIKFLKPNTKVKMIDIEALKLFSVDDNLNKFDQNLYKGFKENLEILQEQLKEKDKQIEALLQLNQNNQILLKQSQDKILKLEEPKKNKRVKEENLFKRLFNFKLE